MGSGSKRQQILILYLANSSLDASVKAWTMYDGTGKVRHMPGDSETPPYTTGLDALLDGWRLIQASPLVNHSKGEEFRLGYMKYEFLFEKLQDCD